MTSLAAVGVALLAAGTVCLTSGCSTIGYYAQSVGGHLAIVRAAKPVPEWLADQDTSAALKARLELSQRIRDFAVTELKEPDNASYRRYADLKRSAAIWNVVAAPELSLKLQTWCFPVVGCVGYRGYYDQAEASVFAESLKPLGLEVSVYGVPAYSTLGLLPGDGLKDPLLNTFINYPEGELARLIFHELAHQIAFAKGDTLFNESFATAVERIGGERWLREHASAQVREDYERHNAQRRDFRDLTARFRDRFNELYESAASDADKRAGKAALMTELRADFEVMKRERWGGYSGYDGWFARANNASFGVLAAYNELVPELRAPVRARGARLHAFLRRGQAAGGPAAGRTTPSIALTRNDMPDIHIHRDHELGLAKARKVALQWAEDAEKKFEMECTIIEGEDQRHGGVHEVGRERRAPGRGAPVHAGREAGLLAGERSARRSRPRSRRTSMRCCPRANRPPRRRPSRRARSSAYFRDSIRSTYSCMASSELLPLAAFHASHFARPTMSEKPGRLPSASPALACLYSA